MLKTKDKKINEEQSIYIATTNHLIRTKELAKPETNCNYPIHNEVLLLANNSQVR